MKVQPRKLPNNFIHNKTSQSDQPTAAVLKGLQDMTRAIKREAMDNVNGLDNMAEPQGIAPAMAKVPKVELNGHGPVPESKTKISRVLVKQEFRGFSPNEPLRASLKIKKGVIKALKRPGRPPKVATTKLRHSSGHSSKSGSSQGPSKSFQMDSETNVEELPPILTPQIEIFKTPSLGHVNLANVKLYGLIQSVIKPEEYAQARTRKRRPSDLDEGRLLEDPELLKHIAADPNLVGAGIMLELPGSHCKSPPILICSICTLPRVYPSRNLSYNLLHGTLVCHLCFGKAEELVEEVEDSLKAFTCIQITNKGNCVSTSPSERLECEACLAKSLLRSMELKQDATFKIWRCIHPGIRGSFKEIIPLRSKYTNRGRIVVLNEKGVFISREGVPPPPGQKLSKVKGGVKTLDELKLPLNGKRVKVILPEEPSPALKLRGARMKQVSYNSGLPQRLPIATFESIADFPTPAGKPDKSQESIVEPTKTPVTSSSLEHIPQNGVYTNGGGSAKEPLLRPRQEREMSNRVRSLLPPNFPYEEHGYPLITLKNYSPPTPSCFLCGSSGIEQLLFCRSCCEPFHPFCLGDPTLFNGFLALQSTSDPPTHWIDRFLAWECFKCSGCTLCNEPQYSRILRCSTCFKPAHEDCAKNANKTGRPLDPKEEWICSGCLACRSCGAMIENASKASLRVLLCLKCYKRRQNGSYCPICDVTYDENDYVTPMLQCELCEKWVHSRCEAISYEDYQILSSLPEDIQFHCKLCRPPGIPTWRSAINTAFYAGLTSILDTFQGNMKSKFKELASKQINSTPTTPLIKLEAKDQLPESFQTLESLPGSQKSPNTENSTQLQSLKTQYGLKDCSILLHDFKKPHSTPFVSISSQKEEFEPEIKPEINEFDHLRSLLKDFDSEMGGSIEDFENMTGFYRSFIWRLDPPLKNHFSPEKFARTIVNVFPWVKLDEMPPLDASNNLLEEPKVVANEPPAKRNPFQAVYWNPEYFIDKRICRFCGEYGDFMEESAGRLLWSGYDNWIHVNCALWSSEVWEDDDGALHQVGAALKRSSKLSCEECGEKGASVSCCHPSCKASYHFVCALEGGVRIQENRKTFCVKHYRYSNDEIQSEFRVYRRVTIDIDILRKFEDPLPPEDLSIYLGSLLIANLGDLYPISVIPKPSKPKRTLLIPLGYIAFRLHWSISTPNLMSLHILSTKLQKYIFKPAELEFNKNISIRVDHSATPEQIKEKFRHIEIFHKWVRKAPRHIDEYRTEELPPCLIDFADRPNPAPNEPKKIKEKVESPKTSGGSSPASGGGSSRRKQAFKEQGVLKEMNHAEEKAWKNAFGSSSQPMKGGKVLNGPKGPEVNEEGHKGGRIKLIFKNGTVKVENHKMHRAEIVYEIRSEGAYPLRSTRVEEPWNTLLANVNRVRSGRIPRGVPNADQKTSLFQFGLNRSSIQWLLEQLPSAELAWGHNFVFHPSKAPSPAPESNSTSSARTQVFTKRKPFDMFGWLASKNRVLPPIKSSQIEEVPTTRGQNLPIAMRFRNLKEKAANGLKVHFSAIHGRGLYTRRDLERGDMIIEYAGEIVRSVLCDAREKYYESKGIGCYFFRIDEDSVIDATTKGNGARFINHSCEPNCESKCIKIHGKNHIIIFALNDIKSGSELTYDYKFSKEEDEKKIPCNCGAKKCRKTLN